VRARDRRTGVAVRVLLVAAAVCAVASLQAAESEGPAIHDNVRYHDLEGDTATELLAALRRVSYAKPKGDHFAAANTRWRLRWNVSVQPETGGCRLVSATSALDVEMNLPRWTPPANARPGLVKSWDTFAAAVRKHEDGHRDIAIEAVREVDRRLQGERTARSCDALRKNLSRIAESVVREYREKDDSYDVTTMHGRTQGVVFP
jgi:predicted secreted Zn-dependent protease